MHHDPLCWQQSAAGGGQAGFPRAQAGLAETPLSRTPPENPSPPLARLEWACQVEICQIAGPFHVLPPGYFSRFAELTQYPSVVVSNEVAAFRDRSRLALAVVGLRRAQMSREKGNLERLMPCPFRDWSASCRAAWA